MFEQCALAPLAVSQVLPPKALVDLWVSQPISDGPSLDTPIAFVGLFPFQALIHRLTHPFRLVYH